MHDIQNELGVKNMSDLTIKTIKGIYDTESPTKKQIKKYKRYRNEFIADLTSTYISEDLAFKVIMYSTVSAAVEFKTKLVSNLYDPITKKEQPVLTKIRKVFASEVTWLQHYASGYKIDLYFPKHKLAIEIDETYTKKLKDKR